MAWLLIILHVILFDVTLFSDRIVVFTQNGEFVKYFSASGKDLNEFATPIGLTLDERAGLLYVADSYNNRIQIFK